jgi:hypothetical protein
MFARLIQKSEKNAIKMRNNSIKQGFKRSQYHYASNFENLNEIFRETTFLPKASPNESKHS